MAVHQGRPFSGTVLVELRDVQRAAIQQGPGAPAVSRIVCLLRNELVDVLEPGVVPGVDDRMVCVRKSGRGGFVLEAAQGGALDRHPVREVRIDFDDPAELVGFVRLPVQVEAAVEAPPRSAAGLLAYAEAGIGGLGDFMADAGVVAEVPVEVLFGRQVRAPRRHAAAAVAESALDSRSVRVGGGHQERVARDWAADCNRGLAVDPAVQPTAAVVPVPLAAGSGVGRDEEHRDAMSCNLVVHLPLVGAIRGVVREDQFRVRVFVVDADDAGIEDIIEPGDEVAVVADLLALGLRVEVIRVELRRFCRQGLAPSCERFPLVALRNRDLVGQRALNGSEGQSRGALVPLEIRD